MTQSGQSKIGMRQNSLIAPRSVCFVCSANNDNTQSNTHNATTCDTRFDIRLAAITLNNADPQNRHDRAIPPAPNPALRVIGACCGAFFFCFLALLISFFQIHRIGEQGANIFALVALICGAIGGFAFPRVGHLLGYGFLVFINLMLALTIGRNLGERLTLFAIFAFIEIVFFMSRRFISREY